MYSFVYSSNISFMVSSHYSSRLSPSNRVRLFPSHPLVESPHIDLCSFECFSSFFTHKLLVSHSPFSCVILLYRSVSKIFFKCNLRGRLCVLTSYSEDLVEGGGRTNTQSYEPCCKILTEFLSNIFSVGLGWVRDVKNMPTWKRNSLTQK